MRTTRNQTPLTKKKISDAMKQNHQNRGEDEKRQTSEKQSNSMKQYWSSIPSVKKPAEKTPNSN